MISFFKSTFRRFFNLFTSGTKTSAVVEDVKSELTRTNDEPTPVSLTAIEQVAQVMRVFQVEPTPENWKLYSSLIREELTELDREIRRKVINRDDVLKESADLLWVVYSKLLLMFTPEQIQLAISLVAQSNLTKALPDTLHNRQELYDYIQSLNGDYEITETEIDGQAFIFAKNTVSGKYQKGPRYQKPVLTGIA